MLKNIPDLYIKIIFFILIITLGFFSNNFLNNKIKNYEKLIMAKEKEIKQSQVYKKKYLKLQKKYNYKTFQKEQIIQRLNSSFDNNNIKILNMKIKEEEKKIFIKLKILSSFANLNNFFYELSLQKSFYDLNNIIIKKNQKNKLIVRLETVFNLSSYINRSSEQSFFENIPNKTKNPYQLNINQDKTNYMIKQKETDIVIKLPILLKGIIIGEKNKLAIITVNNEIKAVDPGFKNSEIEIFQINKNNIKVKYENLIFKIDLGGNKGVIQ